MGILQVSDKFRNKYRIESTRLKNYDYSSNGGYFITICTEDREHYFGEIVDGKMQMSQMGMIVSKYWLEIPNHFPFVKLDEFIIMPDHIHGIVVIDRPVDIIKPFVETPKLGVSTDGNKTTKNNWANGCLGIIINQFKRICTINIRKQFDKNFAWQSRFHDHIIGKNARLCISSELNRIRKYIIENPKNWNLNKNKNSTDPALNAG